LQGAAEALRLAFCLKNLKTSIKQECEKSEHCGGNGTSR
jgi:hypothetical protein